MLADDRRTSQSRWRTTCCERRSGLIDPVTPAERCKVLENALLTYCERDTLAMVRLAEFFAGADSESAATPQDIPASG